MSKDIYLRHNFTDLNGYEVYEAFDADDRLQLLNRLFVIRINQHPSVHPVIETYAEDRVSRVNGGGTG